MFTWFMHPNTPKWFLDPASNLADCVEGMSRVILANGPVLCLTGCCRN